MERVPTRLLVPAIAWQYRLYEPELGRLRDFVPGDRGAVDAGVWWGPWTWWLSRRVPRVHSFEPNAELVARLAPVMPSNVTFHQVALSDRAGRSELWIPRGIGAEGRSSLEPGDRAEAEWSHQSVTTSRLDDFDLGDVGFVKIDVEGHELAVLQGAVGLIADQRPVVMVEVEEHEGRQGPLDTVIEFFASHSYSSRYLLGGRWHAVQDLDRAATREMAQKVARHGYGVNLALYARRYVHNFVFTPDENRPGSLPGIGANGHGAAPGGDSPL
jgi:FkbM family methyltransferase